MKVAMEVAREVLAEIDEGRPDGARIVQLARAVIELDEKFRLAMSQRDRAESQTRSMQRNNLGMRDRIERLQLIADAAGGLLANMGARPVDPDLEVPIAWLRLAVTQ